MENKKKVIRLTENQLVSIIEKTVTEVTKQQEVVNESEKKKLTLEERLVILEEAINKKA
jgi:hypothetical protein